MVVEIYHMRSVPYQPETFENCDALNSGATREQSDNRFIQSWDTKEKRFLAMSHNGTNRDMASPILFVERPRRLGLLFYKHKTSTEM